MKKTMLFKHLKPVCRVIVLLFLGVFAGCAGLELSKPPKGDVAVPAEKNHTYDGKDNVQKAYSNFLRASLEAAKGDYEKAQTNLLEAIKKDPESPYLYQKMAIVLKNTKKYKAALFYADKGVELAPENVKARVLLADLYSFTGDDDHAIEQYQKALDLDPKNRRIRLLLTTILIRKGSLPVALENLEILIRQNPELIIAHYYRGRINLEMGHYPEAEEALLKVLELNNTLEPAMFDLGTLYQVTDRPEKAVETYERLVEIYPDNNIATKERLVNLYLKLGQKKKAEQQMEEIKRDSKPGEPGRRALGLIYLRQGRVDESINELDLIVSAWPEDHKSRYYLATAYEEKGDTEKALSHLKLITQQSKYYINGQMHIAHLLGIQKKYGEAIEILEKAILLEKERIELYHVLSSIYEAKEEYKKAMEVIKEGLKLDEKNTELIFRMGVLLDKSGDRAACLEQMRRVLEINPDHTDSLNYLGYSYAEEAIRLDEAMDLIQKALKLKPGSGYIMDSLGWVYYQKGLYDQAARHLEKAASLTDDDPTINEHLGDVYLKLKRYKAALKHYQKALALKPADEQKLEEKITEVRRLLKHGN
jgi:tetratricopeptide (TPR) repeat protein